MALLVDWLNDGTIPQNKTSGNWTPSAFNTGKFRFTLTFAAASTGSPWRPASLTFWGILTTNDANGGCLWLEYNPSGTTHRVLFIAADGSTELAARTITWGAGATVTITIDQSSATAGASTMTIAGASTGNGTTAGWNRASVYSGTNLYFGAWGGGGFQLPAGSTTTSDIDDAVTGYTITADPGSVPITGTNASTLYGHKMTADAGSIPIGGTDAGLLYGHRLTADPGAVPIAGTDAALTYNSNDPMLVADPGAIPIVGTDAGLVATRVMVADPGSVPIVGTDAATVYGHPITADPGSVPITGVDATLLATRRITADPGAVPIVGTDATLARVGAIGLGDHGIDFQIFGHASRDALVSLDTQVSGAVVLVAAGGKTTDVDQAFTENKSNTIDKRGTTQDYPDYPGYGVSLGAVRNPMAGGTAHEFTVQVSLFDENTTFAVEVRGPSGARPRIAGSSWKNVANAQGGPTIQSDPVTAYGPCVWVCFWFGSGPVFSPPSTPFTAVPNGGFLVVESYLVNNADGEVQAACAVLEDDTPTVASPVTKTVTWSHSPNQGGQVILVAVQLNDAVEAQSGSIPITGVDAGLRTAYRLTADPGSVPIGGTDATLRFGHSMTADGGAVPIVGTDANLVVTRKITADPGAVPIAGSDVGLNRGFPVVADPGSVPITGTDAGLTFSRRLVALAGAVPIAGSDVGLARGVIIGADPGSIPIGGTDANLVVAYRAIALSGSVPIAGTDAIMTYQGSTFLITADPGSIPIVGGDAGLTAVRSMVALGGAIPITGMDANLYVATGDQFVGADAVSTLERRNVAGGTLVTVRSGRGSTLGRA